jgi:hemoglobin
MPENPDAVVYRLIGEEGFERLTEAFYRRVKGDDILKPMYPEGDFEGAELRLREFLVFRFGGPARYIEARGHPRLRVRHAPFEVDRAARDRWVQLMDGALDEVKLPPEAEQVLRGFFHNTATFLINRNPGEGGAGFAGNPRFPVREG